MTNASGAPATNRILSDSQGVNFGYDAAGNMTQAGSVTYGYDGASRLKSVNGTASTYGFDGNESRVRVTEWDGTVFYVRSSVMGAVAMEVNSSGVRRAYVYGGRNQLVAEQSTDGQFYWVHTNHLKSARAMTDVNGNLVYKGQFDPYGQTVTEWSSSGNTSLNTRKFTGYERDATGLDYANARMYNSGRGRFASPDPAGIKAASKRRPQTLNRYSYVSNDPVNFVDPGGTCLYIWNELDGPGFGEWIQLPCVSDLPVPAAAHQPVDEGGGAPQDPYDPRADFRDYALQLSNDPNMTDCLKLALLAYKAGQIWEAQGTAAVASGMLSGLTEYSSVGGDVSDPNFRVGVRRTDPHFAGGFSDSGFKPGYIDQNRDSRNQVRHFTYYLAAGNRLGPLANALLYEAEGTSDSSVPDVGLGETAIKMGELLSNNWSPSNFAQDIWKNVCGQSEPLKLP